MQKIDAHSHVGYFGGWADVGYTDEQMVAEMDRYGIEKSVVSYMDNTVVEQAVKRFPDRFVGITWANPYEGDKAVETVVREVREHGFQGIKLHPLLNAFTANDAVVHPLMEVAQQMDLPVFIHSGHPPFSLPHSIIQLAEDFPKVRIVINCITLETVGEALQVIKNQQFTETDIVQISAARSKEIGRYHMMMGENPIYIITCQKREEKK